MKTNVAIIGLSRFGLNLVETLSKLNVDILALDVDKESVKKATDFTPNAFVIDSTDLDALKSAGVSNVEHAVVAIGQNDQTNLAASVLTITKLKELGVKKITARADDDDYAKILKLVGADVTVSPLYIASERIANKIASKNVIDYFNIVNDYDVFEVEISEDFIPLPIIDLDTRTKYKVNILLINRNGISLVPNKDTILKPNDHIFIFGEKKFVSKITSIFNKSK